MRHPWQLGRGFGWRAICSPWLLAVTAAFLVAMQVLHDVARVLRRSAAVTSRYDQLRAERIAEQVVAGNADERATVQRQGDTITVRVQLPGGSEHVFDGCELPGAAPAVFARSLAFAGDAPGLPEAARVPAAQLPRLEAAFVGAAPSGLSPLLRADPGLALMHWPAGTDAEDFVFAATRGGVDLSAVPPVLVVPGNLWIESAPNGLAVTLPHDLLVVVRGNLYVGGSLQVRGGGRLVLATSAETGTAFVDGDGNGRWSAGETLLTRACFRGAIEGAGNAYFGGADLRAPIELDAAIVVAGQLHVRGAARCCGPVVLAHGCSLLEATAQFTPAGEWRFRVERERVPGFVTAGAPRVGLLRRRSTDPCDLRAMREQPLYLAGPAR